MPRYCPRQRRLYLILICLLALPIAGWATGQSRFAQESPVSFDDRSPATASVVTRSVGRSKMGGTLLVELRGAVSQVFSGEETA